MKRLARVLGIFWGVMALLALVCPGQAAQAAGYPERSIELIIPYPAGAAADINARLMAEEVGKILKQQVVCINKPGGNATLGTDVVVRSKPDGYTILYVGAQPLIHARILDPKTVPYDPVKDLTPLGVNLSQSFAIGVRADAPWKTFKEYIDAAKKNPGEIRISTASAGSTASFALGVIKNLAGIDIIEVPGKGGQQVVTMVLGGHVESTFDIIGKIVPFVESKEMRILFTSRKLADFPDIPTMRDVGYQEDPPSGWMGVFGPAGLPEEVKKVLIPAVRQAAENQAMREKLQKLYYFCEYKSPAEVTAMIQKEFEDGKIVAEKFGIKQ